MNALLKRNILRDKGVTDEIDPDKNGDGKDERSNESLQHNAPTKVGNA